MSCIYICDICKEKTKENKLTEFHRTDYIPTYYNDVEEVRSSIDICDKCLKKINVKKN